MLKSDEKSRKTKVLRMGSPGGQNVRTPRESLLTLSRGSQLPYTGKTQHLQYVFVLSPAPRCGIAIQCRGCVCICVWISMCLVFFGVSGWIPMAPELGIAWSPMAPELGIAWSPMAPELRIAPQNVGFW